MNTDTHDSSTRNEHDTHTSKRRVLCVTALAALVVAATGAASAETDNEWGRRALHLQANLDKDAPLARTTWVGSHNSYANPKNDSLMDYNQPDSVKDQLRYGVRELVFDLHYTNYAIRLCHNGSVEKVCVNGITGNRKFYRGLDDIKAWINEGNEDQVVLLKLELAKSARRNINKVEKKIDGHIAQYLYRPDKTSYHGNLNADTGCTRLDTAKVTKKDVLEAGKNVIIFTSHTCISDGGFNDVVFYADTAVKDAKMDKLKAASDKATVMYRQKDAATRDHELNPNQRDAKIKPSTVNDWLDAGLSIFEVYGFGARNSSWNIDGETPVQPEHMVWSWHPKQPDNRGNQDCALVAKTSRFYDNDCSKAFQHACYSDENGWVITSSTGPWSNGFSACQALGATFRVPVNKPELNQLRNTITGNAVWLNYTDMAIEGEWMANSPSYAHVTSRTYQSGSIKGGRGGSWFNDLNQLVLDLYRSKRRITRIEMSAGNRVDKVGFVYSDGRKVYHGGNSIDRSLRLSTGEYISKAEVCKGRKKGSDRVFYLKFTTSKGRTLSGGSRTSDCTTTSASGKEIFAMRGRSGAEVDALGFYLRPYN